MKTYAPLTIGLLFSLTTACGQTPEGEAEGFEEEPVYQKVKTYQPGNQERNSTHVMKQFVDPQTGMVNESMPFPADWEVTSKGMEAPGGTTVQVFPGGSYTWQQRQISSIDQIIQEDISQLIQRNNSQYLRTIDLPEVAQRDERLGKQYWQATPIQRLHQAKGVEVKDAEGKRVLLVVHFTQTRGQFGVAHNHYYLHALTSNESRYESDKQTLLFALANRQSNPEAVLAFNKKMQQEYIRRQRLFDQKMRQAWAHFNAWNKNHVDTWNDINESSMASWRRINDMRDAGQANTVDGILERERIVDPQTGRQLEVDAGYKYYFTNGNGEYIGTNSEFFNPARDPNLNHEEWRRAPLQGN